MHRSAFCRVLASGVASIALIAAWADPADAATSCADLATLKIAASDPVASQSATPVTNALNRLRVTIAGTMRRHG